MTTRTSFWMISRTGCSAPTFRHATYQAAEIEAKRLARANPGVEYVILEAKKSVIKHDVEIEDLKPSVLSEWTVFIDETQKAMDRAGIGLKRPSPRESFADGGYVGLKRGLDQQPDRYGGLKE